MESKGVLDKKFVIERLEKPDLIFGYKTRAYFVRDIVEKYLNKTEKLHIIDFVLQKD